MVVYPKRERLSVDGGIRSDSRRGAFAHRWWGQRWINELEKSDDLNRLRRGRSYARAGQIAAIEIALGSVMARVQGTRKRPYRVTLRVEKIPLEQWQQIAESLAQEPAMIASLLAGNLPEEIEEVFLRHHCTLFPTCLKKWEVDCSCPDWAVPCKHIAAVYYLLAEEIDRDPFLLLQLLGIKFPVFLSLLEGEVNADQDLTAAEPLPVKLKSFWQGAPLPADFAIPRAQRASASSLLDTLGKFPFWRGEEPLKKQLEPLYHRASESLFKSKCSRR